MVERSLSLREVSIAPPIIFYKSKTTFWKKEKGMEMPGIDPGAFHMQSERSTTELHPLTYFICESKS